MTGNSARSREGAMADAGISKQRFGSPSAKQPIAAAPEPEVKPEPVPVSTEASTLEEESAPAPETIVATNDKPVIQPETELAQDSKPKPQIAEEPETEPVAVAAVEEPQLLKRHQRSKSSQPLMQNLPWLSMCLPRRPKRHQRMLTTSCQRNRRLLAIRRFRSHRRQRVRPQTTLRNPPLSRKAVAVFSARYSTSSSAG